MLLYPSKVVYPFGHIGHHSNNSDDGFNNDVAAVFDFYRQQNELSNIS